VRRPRGGSLRPPRRRVVQPTQAFYGLGEFYGIGMSGSGYMHGLAGNTPPPPLMPPPPPLFSPPPPPPPVAPPPDRLLRLGSSSLFYGLTPADTDADGLAGFGDHPFSGDFYGVQVPVKPPPPPTFTPPPYLRVHTTTAEFEIPEEEFDVPIELIMPMTEFTFVPAVVVAAVMPPAALAGGGGLFSGGGIAVVLATPLPRRPPPHAPAAVVAGAIGRGLHSSTVQLNMSRF